MYGVEGQLRAMPGRLFMAWLVLSGSLLAHADSEDPCEQGSAMAANLCQEPARKAAEAELQSAYDNLMASFKSYDAKLASDLRDAQRTWIRQREQSCSLYARSRVQGSPWTGFWDAECQAEEARTRTLWLKSMLEG